MDIGVVKAERKRVNVLRWNQSRSRPNGLVNVRLASLLVTLAVWIGGWGTGVTAGRPFARARPSSDAVGATEGFAMHFDGDCGLDESRAKNANQVG